MLTATLVTPDLSEAEETMTQQLGDILTAAEDEQEEASVATRVKVATMATRSTRYWQPWQDRVPEKTVLSSYPLDFILFRPPDSHSIP